jgi:hypothetical protein
MAWKAVKNYDLIWHLKAKENERGEIDLVLEDGTEDGKIFKTGRLTYENYSSMANILNSGKPVWCEDKRAILRTSNEKPNDVPRPKKIKIPEDVASFEVRD